MQQSVKQRIIKVLNYYRSNLNIIADGEAQKKRFYNQINGDKKLSSDTVEMILSIYPEVSSEWLLRGIGDMIREPDSKKSGVPFYGALHASAGQLDTFCQSSQPSGYIQLPDVHAVASFPVVGCSMEPLIKAGDIIAVDNVDNDRHLDPDKIYMIITKSERMIKHLRIDNEDDSFVWAISLNYKEFRIAKSEIVKIYQVVYFGRLV